RRDAIVVGGRCGNGVLAGAFINVRDRTGVTGDVLNTAVAPVDGPSGNGVLAGVRGAQVERVRAVLIDGGRARNRQSRRHVVDVDGDGVEAGEGSVFVDGRGGDGVIVGTIGIDVCRGCCVADERGSCPIAPADAPAGDRVQPRLVGRQGEGISG